MRERERVKKLEELREADVLTAEEFQEALEKIGGEKGITKLYIFQNLHRFFLETVRCIAWARITWARISAWTRGVKRTG